MLKSGLCNYKDAYILVKGTATVVWTNQQYQQLKKIKKNI